MLTWQNRITNIVSELSPCDPCKSSGSYAYYGCPRIVKLFDVPIGVEEFLVFYCAARGDIDYGDRVAACHLMSRSHTYAYPVFVSGRDGSSTYENAYLVCENGAVYFYNDPDTSLFPEAYPSVTIIKNSGGVTVYSLNGKRGVYLLIPLITE